MSPLSHLLDENHLILSDLQPTRETEHFLNQTHAKTLHILLSPSPPSWSSGNQQDGVSHLAQKNTASVFADEMKVEESGKKGLENLLKKNLFQLQTNPLG